MKHFFLVLFLLPFTLFSWWDAGHMAVAKIAYDRLNPHVRDKVDALLQKIDSKDFVTSACWADDIGREDLEAFATWHYVTLPYDPEGILPDACINAMFGAAKKSGVCWAVMECEKTLGSEEASDFSKALMLRFFIHFVADIHQPLHTTSKFSKELPEGDRGGNLFIISSDEVTNLHAFWDSMCGLSPSWERPLSEKDREDLARFVEEIIKDYPPSAFSQIHGKDPAHWMEESHLLGTTYVYQDIEPHTFPTPFYIERGQEICKKRIALAGYRLASRLNSLLK